MKSNRVLLGLCIAVLAFVATSCNNSAKKNCQMAAVGDSIVSDTEDSLVFVTLRDSVLKDSAYTHSLTFQFPVSGSKGVRESIGRYLSEKLSYFCPTINMTNDAEVRVHTYRGDITDGRGLLSHYMKEYTTGFENLTNEFGIRSDMLMFQEVVGSVVWESDKALTYCIAFENFLGGAHGEHLQSARTFRKTDGKMIQLIDSTQLDRMQALMYEGLKDYLGQDITPNFNMKVSDMLFVKRIPLPADHLVMRQNGLFFLYQLDEIAGYVYGMPCFTLPYDKVMPFMTAEAVELIPQQKKQEKQPSGKRK
ncbi:RsiV family protein [Hoylesella timonensis]|uniref:RsiV family protein n=1 Tax=Hoylesella timonensis TaxID=386414 RepID=UPI000490B255|nr:RsiV family protein [Hoylesella timonensis]